MCVRVDASCGCDVLATVVDCLWWGCETDAVVDVLENCDCDRPDADVEVLD